jgi:hypothetical protein
MDPIVATAAVVLAASALYRTLIGKRGAFLTAGLWTAALATVIGAVRVPLDTALKGLTGLDNLHQTVSYSVFIVSSYLIAQMTYYVAGIDSRWPIVFTVLSITGMIVLFFATDLSHGQTNNMQEVPGAASAWFLIAFAVGFFPTHISAIIGVLKMEHKDNVVVWLLAIYGGVGAVYPLLMVADRIGTHTARWSYSVTGWLEWVIWSISMGALSAAGVIGAYRTTHDGRVGVELAASA